MYVEVTTHLSRNWLTSFLNFIVQVYYIITIIIYYISILFIKDFYRCPNIL